MEREGGGNGILFRVPERRWWNGTRNGTDENERKRTVVNGAVARSSHAIATELFVNSLSSSTSTTTDGACPPASRGIYAPPILAIYSPVRSSSTSTLAWRMVDGTFGSATWTDHDHLLVADRPSRDARDVLLDSPSTLCRPCWQPVADDARTTLECANAKDQRTLAVGHTCNGLAHTVLTQRARERTCVHAHAHWHTRARRCADDLHPPRRWEDAPTRDLVAGGTLGLTSARRRREAWDVVAERGTLLLRKKFQEKLQQQTRLWTNQPEDPF